MKLNKPKSIQGLTEIKRLKPIGKLLQIEEWQNEETMSTIDIICLSINILCKASRMINEGNYDDRVIDSHLETVKTLARHTDNGYILTRDYKAIKKQSKIKDED